MVERQRGRPDAAGARSADATADSAGIRGALPRPRIEAGSVNYHEMDVAGRREFDAFLRRAFEMDDDEPVYHGAQMHREYLARDADTGRLLGYASMRPPADSVVSFNVAWVAPEARRIGVYTTLLRSRLEDVLADPGAKEIEADTKPASLNGIRKALDWLVSEGRLAGYALTEDKRSGYVRIALRKGRGAQD